MNRREGSVGWCRDCANLEPLKDERCYDCWHEWRESHPCWKVRADRPDDYPHQFIHLGDYLEHEAKLRAAEINAKEHEERVVAFEYGPWLGERMGHPGYMKRRVASMLGHPSFEEWRTAMGEVIRWWT